MADPVTIFVGVDVHKESISVAYAWGHDSEPPHSVGKIGPRRADIDKLIRRLHSRASHLVFASSVPGFYPNSVSKETGGGSRYLTSYSACKMGVLDG